MLALLECMCFRATIVLAASSVRSILLHLRCIALVAVFARALRHRLQVSMLHIGLQQQVDAVRQGISEVFSLAKLDQLSGLNLIDAIGANPVIEDEEWEQMIEEMKRSPDSPDSATTYLKLVQDALRLVKTSAIGNHIVLFGSRNVDVQAFRREICKAVFGVPQVNTSKHIVFTTILTKPGAPCHFDGCQNILQLQESQSRLNFQTSNSAAAQTHQIKVLGAARLQLQFEPPLASSSFQGNKAARVSPKSFEIESRIYCC